MGTKFSAGRDAIWHATIDSAMPAREPPKSPAGILILACEIHVRITLFNVDNIENRQQEFIVNNTAPICQFNYFVIVSQIKTSRG